MKTIKPVESVY